MAQFPGCVLVLLISGPGHIRQGPGVRWVQKCLSHPVSAAQESIFPSWRHLHLILLFDWLHRLISRSLRVLGCFFLLMAGEAGLRYLHKNLSTRLTALTRQPPRAKIPHLSGGSMWSSSCVPCVYLCTRYLVFVQSSSLWLEIPKQTVILSMDIKLSLGQLCLGWVLCCQSRKWLKVLSLCWMCSHHIKYLSRNITNIQN